MKKLLLFLLVALALSGLVPARGQSAYENYAFATVAGISPGKVDGTGSAARFQNPQSVARDSAGSIYVADSNNHAIRKITPAGVVSTFAGLLGEQGYVDGPALVARFAHPSGIALDSAGDLWVADAWNYAIRKITPDGMVSTFAGGTLDTGSEMPFSELSELQWIAVVISM